MRIVIEVLESERAALQSLQDLYHTTYSAVFRAWLKLTVDGTVPTAKLRAALESPRPVLNVTVTGTDLAKDTRSIKEHHGWDVQSDKDLTERPPRRVKKK